MTGKYLNTIILTVCLSLFQVIPVLARSNFDFPVSPEEKHAASIIPLIHADQLRHTVLHNAGAFYTPIYDGIISFYAGGAFDSETGEFLGSATYPSGSGKYYIWCGAMWVGGIVDQDTLVSVGFDNWFVTYELMAEDRSLGGARRTGHFADDEFVTVVADTGSVIQSPFGHTPLGIQVEVKSLSWADTLYDDFIILDYVVRNIGDNYIADSWIGFYCDFDIYHVSNQLTGFQDDLSGLLDTLLYDGDESSRLLLPYSYDNDGDPPAEGGWDSAAVRAAITMMVLASDFPVECTNFNWWNSNSNPALDWGPRRLGTPEDPLRLFNDGNLGTPLTDGDKYYMMAHPEIDYNQIKTAINDSSAGWIPPLTPAAAVDFADGWDTRFLYSFGPFDLPPGDSTMFAVALVAGPGLHVNPYDWAGGFDPLLPHIFEETLDFSELMTICRRADSVYKSGYTLPYPGPPAGLRVVDYDDGFIDVAWHASRRPDLEGYYLYIIDSVYGSQWGKITPLLEDTTATIHIYEPTHTYHIGVSLIDTLGRESDISMGVSLVPGIPHPPESLTVFLDGMIPEIAWRPYDDTTIQGFLIYRAEWNGAFELYDSTAALKYRDYEIESGVQYKYMVSTINILDLESEKIGPVSALPMALDQGILYCNLNRYHISTPPPYQRLYLDRLYESVASLTGAKLINVMDREIPFKTLADYSLLILDEGNVPRTLPVSTDSLTNYMGSGGKVIFIKPAFSGIATAIRKHIYGEGDFHHDFLKLDSAVTNAYVVDGGNFLGDLYSCQSSDPAYPHLFADTAKLAGSLWPLEGYIPISGYLYPSSEADLIYSYISSNPDTTHHGVANGIRYAGEDYGFVLLSFPLMAMEEPESFRVLKQALTDLGVDMNCGDSNMDGAIDIGDAIGLIAHIYRGGPEPAGPAYADVNCNGEIELADIVTLINYIFKSGWLECCQ